MTENYGNRLALTGTGDNDPVEPGQDRLLTPQECADILVVSARTLADWRAKDSKIDGPLFVSVGGAVRYRRSDVDAWIASRVQSRAS